MRPVTMAVGGTVSRSIGPSTTRPDAPSQTAKPLFGGSIPPVASNSPTLPGKSGARIALVRDADPTLTLPRRRYASWRAGVAEQADAADLNSAARKGVWVRTPPPAPHFFTGSPSCRPQKRRAACAARLCRSRRDLLDLVRDDAQDCPEVAAHEEEDGDDDYGN